MKISKQAGGTLIEMVIAIVVISIAMVGILSSIHAASKNSVDPVIQVQGIALANSVIQNLYAEPFSRIESKTWEMLQAEKAGSAFLAAAQERKFDISIEVSQEELEGVPAHKVKRIDVIVKHFAFKEKSSIVLTTYQIDKGSQKLQIPMTPLPFGGF